MSIRTYVPIPKRDDRQLRGMVPHESRKHFRAMVSGAMFPAPPGKLLLTSSEETKQETLLLLLL